MVRSPIFVRKHVGWQTWLQGTWHARIGRRIPAPLGSAGFLLALLIVSAVSALVGGLLARRMPVTQDPLIVDVPTEHLAEAGGLLLRMEAVTWLGGSPAGGPRLRVELTLQNPTDQTQAINPHEFLLRARGGLAWPASGNSMATTTLAPRQALSGALFFEVPAATAGLELVWTRDHEEVRIPIRDEGVRLPRGGAGEVVKGDAGAAAWGVPEKGRSGSGAQPVLWRAGQYKSARETVDG